MGGASFCRQEHIMDTQKMTDDSAGRHYLISQQGVVFLAMVSDGNVPNQAKVEIAEIVTAWWYGRIVPRRETPTLTSLFDLGEELPGPEPAPVSIAGGARGLQKHLVALADKNRGLEPAVLKTLFDEHQVVIAVWPSLDPPGEGFLTLKGIEHLSAQAKRGARKYTATMTAIPCTNKDHAELLQQAFASAS
jgi:hypothetical protein